MLELSTFGSVGGAAGNCRLYPAKAARCGVASLYPWGDDPDPNRANYDATGINTTSAVGCFLGGASPYGCLDMVGNVWEWTRSVYKKYPYDPADGRENLAAGWEAARVLRGGAYYSDASSARCAPRRWYYPRNRVVNHGFRLVVSPTLPSP